MKRKIMVGLLVGSLLVSILVSSGLCAPRLIQIKLTTVQLDNQQMGVAAQQLKKLADKRLASKIRLNVYTGAQLYSGVEELEAIKKGDIQLCLAIGSAMGSLDPTMSIFKLPFLFPNVEVAYKVLDGPIGEKVFTNIKRQGIDVLGGFSSGSIIISNSSRPLLTPADFKGLKMRTSGKMEAAIIESLGAISTVIPSEETYTGLQQKVIDGLATPSTVFYARKYHEVQKYVTNAGILYWSNGFILTNDKFWNGLPKDVRNELRRIVDQVLKDVRASDEAELLDMLKKLEAGGIKVHTLTPEEITAWRKAALPVYKQYEKVIGANLIAEVNKEIKKVEGSSK